MSTFTCWARWVLLPTLLLVVSCKTIASPGTPEQSGQRNVLRVALKSICPTDLSGAQYESLVGIVALSVIPPLVQSGIRGIGSAIKKAGEARAFSLSATDTMDFYSIDETGHSFVLNPASICLIVFRGKVGQDGHKALEDHEFFRRFARKLNLDLDLVAPPEFYYEAYLRPAREGTAFKLEPKLVYYGNRIGPNRRDKELVMTISFATPAKTIGEEEAFAIFSTTFVRPSTGELKEGYPFQLQSYQSSYRTLPKASGVSQDTLTAYTTDAAQLETYKEALSALDREEDPEILVLDRRLLDLRSERSSAIDMARRALDHARLAFTGAADDEENRETIAGLRRQLDEARGEDELATDIRRTKEDIASRRQGVPATDQRKGLVGAIEKLEEQNRIAFESLSRSTPVNVTVTLVESTDANRVLVAIGEALEGAADDVKEIVVASLTPADPEAELAKTVADLQNKSALRTEAITAGEAWRKARNAYDVADEQSKPEKLSNLRVQYLAAKLKCDIAEASGVVEPVCFALSIPPDGSSD